MYIVFIVMFDIHPGVVPDTYNGVSTYTVMCYDGVSSIRLYMLLWKDVPEVEGSRYVVLYLPNHRVWVPLGVCDVFKANMRISDVWEDEHVEALHLPVGIVVQWAWEYVLKGIVSKNEEEQSLVVSFLRTCMDEEQRMCLFAEEFRDMLCKSIQEKEIDVY